MDYATFVARGQARWDRMEALADGAGRDLGGLSADELEALVAAHRAVVSDFAWARTRYPDAGTTGRLRALAFRGHQLLAAPDPPLLRRTWRFLSVGYPRLFQQTLPATVGATGLFIGATLLGVVVGGVNPDVARLFIGDEAIQGLREGAIWTDDVGGSMPASARSTLIFTNNIRVALLAWAGGALAGLGSAGALLFNGLMFGCMLTVTWQFGMLDRLHAWVAAHGPLELFLICCAGGAGFTLARGLVDDRGRPLAQTLAEAGRRSVRLAIGTVPWFVLCGIVEGTISPQMALPTAAKQALGVLMLAVFGVYALVPRATRGAA